MIPSKPQRRMVGIIKIVLIFVMSIIFSIQSCLSQSHSGQHQRKLSSSEISLNNLRPRNRPVYVGLNLSMDAPRYQLKSNIDALNNLPVNYFGGRTGGVLANPIGKIQGGVGIYYSGDNVPYTFDLLTANLTFNLYLLRIRQVKYHTFEPYVFAGVSEMKNRFYGYYISEPSAKRNYSASEPPYIGSVTNTQLLAGTGVEYQLENNLGDFIHLYAEISYGSPIRSRATRDALSGSVVPNSLWITLGISFGKYK
jgi:hypothetical protein